MYRQRSATRAVLGPHVPGHWKEQLKRRGLRVACIRSQARRKVESVRLFTCSAQRPGAEPSVLWHREVGSLADVAEATEHLGANVDPSVSWKIDASPIFLVCTNGRHDQCCANLGRPLIRALRETQWSDRAWE